MRKIHSSDESHDNQNVNSEGHCQTQRAYVNYVFSSQDETDPILRVIPQGETMSCKDIL